MSPILKRDISDQLRQALRLAQALTSNSTSSDIDGERELGIGMSIPAAYASSSSLRKGIGVEEDMKVDRSVQHGWMEGGKGKGKEVEKFSLDEGDEREAESVLHSPVSLGIGPGDWRDRIRIEEMDFAEPEIKGSTLAKWKDLRNLLFEVCLHCLNGKPV
jgi:hypothetical protein